MHSSDQDHDTSKDFGKKDPKMKLKEILQGKININKAVENGDNSKLDFTFESSKMNNSVLPLKSLTSKNKVTGY